MVARLVTAELVDHRFSLSASSDSAAMALTQRHRHEEEEAQVALIRCLGNLCAGSEVCAQAARALAGRLARCVNTETNSKYTARASRREKRVDGVTNGLIQEALRTLSYVMNGATQDQQLEALGVALPGEYLL